MTDADPREKSAPSAPWRSILSDPDVARWHRGFGSETTADERARILYRYCRIHKTTPAKIARRAGEGNGGRRQVRDQLEDFCSQLLLPHKPSDHGEDDGDGNAVETCRRGHKRGYVENYVKAVRSFLESLDVELGKVRLGRNSEDAEEDEDDVENEHVPTQAEMPAILAAATLRGKVCVSLVGLAVLRPETLGTKKAKNGLVLEDLPEVKILPGTLEHPRGVVSVTNAPTLVRVRKELSKVRRKYVVFLVEEGCEHLRAYLQYRLDHGETLGPTSPVVVPERGFERKGRPEEMQGSRFLTTQAISKDIREAIRGAGLRCRPYTLRKYGAGALQSACRAGKLTELDREFFLGRKSAITLVYTHHHELPPEKVEELRAAFAKCTEYLTGKTEKATRKQKASELARSLVTFAADLKMRTGDRTGIEGIVEDFEAAAAEMRRILEGAKGDEG